MQDWMIYGANGYTGRLIAAAAAQRGWRPVLAGRSAVAVESLGDTLGLPTRVFDLADAAAVERQLTGMRLVMHCAGPYSATSRPMLDGCLAAGAHYLDITGELEIFKQLFERAPEVLAAGISAVPGTGFDVVPTDCLAALLKRELPDATWLRLALHGPKSISAGTAKSIVEGLAKGSCVRHDGQLLAVSATYRTLEVPFEAHPSPAVTVSLGDLVTAYHSTQIPNIETYLRADGLTLAALKLLEPLAPILGAKPVQDVLKQLTSWLAQGPSEHELATGKAVVWGEVENAAAQKVAMRLHTPDAYALTVSASLHAIERVLAGKVAVGVASPATAFGADFVLSLPGVSLERLTLL